MEENKDKDNITKAFVWWMGVVEDRNDPLKIGRCRVRIHGYHNDDKNLIPTSSLPWAHPAYSSNNTNPYAPKESDLVFGFFMDGEQSQKPVIVGVMPSIPINAAQSNQGFNDPRGDSQLASAPRTPESKTYNTDGTGISITEKSKASTYPINLDEPTTSRLARNESISKTFIQERKDNKIASVPTVSGTWEEPETKYDAKYPYNNVNETESGHIVELDDTVGKERVHIAHRSGTFQEMYPDGSKVEKITKNNYQIVMADDHVYIMGKCTITVQGDAEVYVQKDAYMKVDGKIDVKVAGTYTVTAGGNMKFVAPRIDLNP
jgi:hypothetical protein